MVLLQRSLEAHDAILMRVLSVSAQNILAQPIKVYSNRFCGPAIFDGEPIQFIGSAGSWGNVCLTAGEKAVVFLRDIGDRRIYQEYWHGHLSVVDIEGVEHAMAHWELLSFKPWEPKWLYESAFHPYPENPRKTAIPFDLLERHLQEILANEKEKQGSE